MIARKRTQQEQNTINKNDAERIAKDSADKEKLKKYMIATLEEYRVEANRKLPVNLQITRINFSN